MEIRQTYLSQSDLLMIHLKSALLNGGNPFIPRLTLQASTGAVIASQTCFDMANGIE